jgi:hypothetical protein
MLLTDIFDAWFNRIGDEMVSMHALIMVDREFKPWSGKKNWYLLLLPQACNI